MDIHFCEFLFNSFGFYSIMLPTFLLLSFGNFWFLLYLLFVIDLIWLHHLSHIHIYSYYVTWLFNILVVSSYYNLSLYSYCCSKLLSQWEGNMETKPQRNLPAFSRRTLLLWKVIVDISKIMWGRVKHFITVESGSSR